MLLWVRLHEDAAAQPGGARHPARGDPAEHELDPPAEHQVPPRHPALPLLPLLPGLSGAPHLPLPVPVPGAVNIESHHICLDFLISQVSMFGTDLLLGCF